MSEENSLLKKFEQAGQGQVFRFWDHLDEKQRERLLAQAREIDLDEVESLVNTHLGSQGGDGGIPFADLEPAPYVPLPEQGGDSERWRKAAAMGEDALRNGRVAAFTVAGGQGTRLGYDGPKGTFPATPVRQKPLFQVFAEKILAASRRYGVPLPWFIMTSHANHEATVDFFKEHRFFGLNEGDVHFFMQGRMPAVDPQGKIMLSAPDEIAMSPDGHGGSLRALVRSGATKTMSEQGIDILSYFQVDNPLVQCIDPAFIGFHMTSGCEMSSKMIPKAYPLEKVGHFCRLGDKVVVVEYSDLPEAMQEERTEDGELRFKAGSVAIHILSRSFVDRMGGGNDSFSLPFHRADKKIPYVDDQGKTVQPDDKNGVKFEMFVFDALPFAKDPVIIEAAREDDFSPIKNAEGKDSPETARQDQLRQWTRWARAAGVEVPTDESGLPPFSWEVSPLFADSEPLFLEKWEKLSEKPAIGEGTYLE